MPYIPNTPEEQQEMLQSLGMTQIADLFVDIAENLRLTRPLDLPEALTEPELLRYMGRLAQKMSILTNMFLFWVQALMTTLSRRQFPI